MGASPASETKVNIVLPDDRPAPHPSRHGNSLSTSISICFCRFAMGLRPYAITAIMEAENSHMLYSWFRNMPQTSELLLNNKNTKSFVFGLLVGLVVTYAVRITFARYGKRPGPPSLSDPLPFVYNSTQFIFSNKRFLSRVSKALANSPIVTFRLFQAQVFLIAGQRNIQTLFARSHKVGTEAFFLQHVLPNLYRMPKADVQRLAGDRSGRDRVPASGWEKVPANQRYWHGYHHVHNEYLAKTQYLMPISRQFTQLMIRELDANFSAQEYQHVSLIRFCRQHVATWALQAMFGSRFFQVNPGLLDAFWKFDSSIFELTMGLPRWLTPAAYNAQDRYYTMIQNYLNVKHGVPAAQDSGTDILSGAIVPGLVNWVRESEFEEGVAAGSIAMLTFALISNTIPTCMWIILEIVRNPNLFNAIREEVYTVCTIDASSKMIVLHADKVTSLPLLQSVFTEILRLHVNFNLMRSVNEPVEFDGVTLPTGSLVQAPMKVAHFDESVWGRPEHPASEFWAERHIKVKDGKRIFSMAGRPSAYFPFGGGAQICPGRHLAKHEILNLVATLVTKYDVELLAYTNLDGSHSKRAAGDDDRFSGLGAMPLDRDVQMRWRCVADVEIV